MIVNPIKAAFVRHTRDSGCWHIRQVLITRENWMPLCEASDAVPWTRYKLNNTEEICSICLAKAQEMHLIEDRIKGDITHD